MPSKQFLLDQSKAAGEFLGKSWETERSWEGTWGWILPFWMASSLQRGEHFSVGSKIRRRVTLIRWARPPPRPHQQQRQQQVNNKQRRGSAGVYLVLTRRRSGFLTLAANNIDTGSAGSLLNPHVVAVGRLAHKLHQIYPQTTSNLRFFLQSEKTVSGGNNISVNRYI